MEISFFFVEEKVRTTAEYSKSRERRGPAGFGPAAALELDMFSLCEACAGIELGMLSMSKLCKPTLESTLHATKIL